MKSVIKKVKNLLKKENIDPDDFIEEFNKSLYCHGMDFNGCPNKREEGQMVCYGCAQRIERKRYFMAGEDLD